MMVTTLSESTRASVGVRALRVDDSGMTTAEYAVGTVAAAGLGGLLYKILTSDAVTGLITNLIQQAFAWAFGQ